MSLQGTTVPRSKINTALQRTNMLVPNNRINTTKINKHRKGVVNKLEKETQSVSLHVNSLFRDDYFNDSATNFTYTLPVNIENVLSARLTSVNLPNTWYLFESEKGNNTFYIELFEVNSNDSSINPRERPKDNDGVPLKAKHIHQIVIPDGNYTATGLETFLNSTYFKDVAEGIIDGNQDQYQRRMKKIEFKIDRRSLKSSFVITQDEGSINQMWMNIVFVDEHSKSLIQTAGWKLGFRNAKYLNITNSVISEGLFDAAGERYLYFCLNDHTLNQTNNNIICLDNTFIDTHVLAKINVGTTSWGIQIDDTPDTDSTHSKTRIYAGPTNLKKFDIKILDMFGKPINLNSMDWSFTIELEKLYQNII